MPKLYLLAVGGTGVRVTKALINLLATGVDVPPGPNGEPWKVIPLVIDPHKDGKDLLRMSAQLKRYRTLHDAAIKTGNGKAAAGGAGWFATEVRTVGELVDHSSSKDPIAHLGDIGNKRFSEYIGLDGLTGAQRAMASALYSDDQLGVTMDIGFVGNPAIGVVALEELNKQSEIVNLASSFQQGDRIFIVSSIFGGTGSAAFPILVKLLRNPGDLPNGQWLRDAMIGALSVQPYFRVEDINSRIRQAEFMQRTKAALSYYLRTMPGTLQHFYTIGENSEKAIENDPGDGGQQNPAHFVELAGALSVLHFLDCSDAESGAKLEEHQYALKTSSTGGVTFQDLPDQDRSLLERPMTGFALYARYLLDVGKQELLSSTDLEYLKVVGTSFGRSPQGEALIKFFEDWQVWAKEMGSSARSFSPFLNSEPYLGMIKGVDPKRKMIWQTKLKGPANLIDFINEAQKNTTITEPLPHLLAFLGRGVTAAVEDTYQFN